MAAVESVKPLDFIFNVFKNKHFNASISSVKKVLSMYIGNHIVDMYMLDIAFHIDLRREKWIRLVVQIRAFYNYKAFVSG